MKGPLDFGFLQLSDVSLKPLKVSIAFGQFQVGIHGYLWNPSTWKAKISATTAELKVKAVAHSLVKIPRLGLEGSGHYILELKDLRIDNNYFRGKLQGDLHLQSGPLDLQAKIQSEGYGPIDKHIDVSQWQEHLRRAGNRARGDFRVEARITLGPASAHLSGNGDLSAKSFHLNGQFSGGVPGLLGTRGTYQFDNLQGLQVDGQFAGGLPPLLYTRGAYQYDQRHGLRVRGFSAGLLTPGFNGLGPARSHSNVTVAKVHRTFARRYQLD